MRSLRPSIYAGKNGWGVGIPLQTQLTTNSEKAGCDLQTICGIAVSLALALTCSAPAHGAESYRIDPGQSAVNFAVKHMVLTTVHGKFTEFSGTLELDEHDLAQSSVKVTINAASVTTENAPRDKDLRSSNFLDAEKYPEIIFASRLVEKTNGGYVLIGNLTMHGVSKEVRIPFTYTGKVRDLAGKSRVGFEGHVTINRKDWGITYSKVADNGGLVAANEVAIELDVEAVRNPSDKAISIRQK